MLQPTIGFQPRFFTITEEMLRESTPISDQQRLRLKIRKLREELRQLELAIGDWEAYESTRDPNTILQMPVPTAATIFISVEDARTESRAVSISIPRPM